MLYFSEWTVTVSPDQRPADLYTRPTAHIGPSTSFYDTTDSSEFEVTYGDGGHVLVSASGRAGPGPMPVEDGVEI